MAPPKPKPTLNTLPFELKAEIFDQILTLPTQRQIDDHDPIRERLQTFQSLTQVSRSFRSVFLLHRKHLLVRFFNLYTHLWPSRTRTHLVLLAMRSLYPALQQAWPIRLETSLAKPKGMMYGAVQIGWDWEMVNGEAEEKRKVAEMLRLYLMIQGIASCYPLGLEEDEEPELRVWPLVLRKDAQSTLPPPPKLVPKRTESGVKTPYPPDALQKRKTKRYFPNFEELLAHFLFVYPPSSMNPRSTQQMCNGLNTSSSESDTFIEMSYGTRAERVLSFLTREVAHFLGRRMAGTINLWELGEERIKKPGILLTAKDANRVEEAFKSLYGIGLREFEERWERNEELRLFKQEGDYGGYARGVLDGMGRLFATVASVEQVYRFVVRDDRARDEVIRGIFRNVKVESGVIPAQLTQWRDWRDGSRAAAQQRLRVEDMKLINEGGWKKMVRSKISGPFYSPKNRRMYKIEASKYCSSLEEWLHWEKHEQCAHVRPKRSKKGK